MILEMTLEGSYSSSVNGGSGDALEVFEEIESIASLLSLLRRRPSGGCSCGGARLCSLLSFSSSTLGSPDADAAAIGDADDGTPPDAAATVDADEAADDADGLASEKRVLEVAKKERRRRRMAGRRIDEMPK